MRPFHRADLQNQAALHFLVILRSARPAFTSRSCHTLGITLAFITRTLSIHDAAFLNLEAHGIPQSRVPTSPQWPFAIDEEKGALFTQLIGTTGEMRDGYYYYALVWRGNVAIFCRESGHLTASELVVSFKHSKSEAKETLGMAREAVAALDSLDSSPPQIIISG